MAGGNFPSSDESKGFSGIVTVALAHRARALDERENSRLEVNALAAVWRRCFEKSP